MLLVAFVQVGQTDEENTAVLKRGGTRENGGHVAHLGPFSWPAFIIFCSRPVSRVKARALLDGDELMALL